MFSIGESSYPDLRGVDQLIQTERMALQFWSVKVDFDNWMATKGRTGRLSANEGWRSESRCYYLWDNRFVLGIVVAPPLTSRHYRFPNAIDFGITESDGSNRALAPDEFEKLHELVELRGGTWTGVNFGEPWHHEMATRQEVLPPYPNARELAEAGPQKPITPTPKEEDDMAPRLTRVVQPGHPKNGLVSFTFPTHVHDTGKSGNGDQEIYEIGRAYGVIPAGGKWQDHVEDIAYGEYQRLVEMTREGRAAIANNVWAHTFTTGDSAGGILSALAELPRKVWAYVFSDSRSAGVYLKNIIGAKITKLVPDDEQPAQGVDATKGK